MLLSKNSARVQTYLDQFDIKLEVQELSQSTRTAQEAADAVGCELGQIVKSLVFKSGQIPLLFLVSGKNQLNIKKVESILGMEIQKADADFAREHTGYPIGGVPPVAHENPIDIFIDNDLMTYEEIWAAAGTPNAIFRIKSKDLPGITNGRIIEVK